MLTRRLRSYVLVALCSLLFAYAILEAGVRVIRLPQKSLIFDIEREIDRSNGDLASHFPAHPPIYGWDMPNLILPASDKNEARRSVVFVGDSVTRGHGVDPHTEAYPSVLFRRLDGAKDLRLVNAAVAAFGVDQMMLKLERTVAEHEPAAAVLAYIPHDLWRAGRNINNGITKPVVLGFEDQTWQLVPARNMVSFYERYLHAKKFLYMGPWVLGHVAENARYYFSGMNAAYYQTLFRAIRDRLIALGESNRMQVVVVRLASMWPGDAVPALDRMANAIFGRPADANYSFVDTEACVRAAARGAGIDFEQEFSWHPGPRGHAIYAECLYQPLSGLLP